MSERVLLQAPSPISDLFVELVTLHVPPPAPPRLARTLEKSSSLPRYRLLPAL